MSIEQLEDAINQVTDDNRSWWPFLWMRPEQHKRLSLGRLFVLALLYGLPIGGLGCLLIAFLEPVSRGEAPFVVVGFPTMLFLFGSVVIAPMWNRRADRLRHRKPM